MADKKRIHTDAQKYSKDFEDLSKEIVEYLFRKTNVKINKTAPNKDGGYDIIVSRRYNHCTQKAFFECKLRKENMNLRDIAANAIIAFNQGSVALVAVTNHDYTPQAGSQFHSFRSRTVLNIKIITGGEFWELVKRSHKEEKVSEELKRLICPSKRGKENGFASLRIDFDRDIIQQIFCKEDYTSKEDAVISQMYPKQTKELIQCLESGMVVVVTGYWGVGKNDLIHAGMRRCSKRVIEIDAQFAATKDQTVLLILSRIWGISELKLFSSFTKRQVDEILHEIGEEENDKETVQILMSLLNEEYGDKRSSTVQNMLIVQYIVKLMVLHKETIGFAVYINNLQFASKEVYDFLLYFVKEMHESKIGCVLRYEKPEYQLDGSLAFVKELRRLSRCKEISLAPLGNEDAVQYIKTLYPELSNHTADVIVTQVGNRAGSLSSILMYLFQQYSPTDEKRLIGIVQNLTANDAPGLTDVLLCAYQSEYPCIFETCHLLDCRVPIKVYQLGGNSPQDLDRMIEAGLFHLDQNIITASNGFVRNWIRKMHGAVCSAYSLFCADMLLNKLEGEKEEYPIEKISLYYTLGRDKEALALLDKNLHELTRDKQYTALSRALSLAIKIAHRMNDVEREADYLIQTLYLMTIQKELTDELAQTRIDRLADCIGYKQALPSYMPVALAFFRLKRSFKMSEYTDNLPSVQKAHDYYTKCICFSMTENEGDWLGRLCACYALTVKSTQGNDAALRVFEASLQALPRSFELRREYLSHLACMELFNDPTGAFFHYQEILALFDREAPDSAELPFHEYGDLAMAQLIAGNLREARELVEKAIRISQSNGLIDEEGRNLNIKGCIELCAGEQKAAKASFREATATMRHAGCRHYAWRSELNYIELCVKDVHDSTTIQKDLERLYDEFKDLLADKIAYLAADGGKAFYQTREYHALLVFGACWKCLKKPIIAQTQLPEDFKLNMHTETYRKHLRCFLAGKEDFMKSPYLKNGYIYLVG